MKKNWRASTRAYFRQLGKRALTQVLPEELLNKVDQEKPETRTYPKLPFPVFVKFMVSALLWRDKKPSTRRLVGLSGNCILRHVSGVKKVSHTAIADRLKSLPLDKLRTVFDYVKDSARPFLRKTLKGIDFLKLGDCTTIEGNKALFPWAANNGDKNAIRFAVTIDAQSDTPDLALDASTTTSDNSVFPKLVANLKAGETLVLDAGFTRLTDFKMIQYRQAYWIAHMAEIYHVEPISEYKLPRKRERYYNGWALCKDERVMVGTDRSGGPLEVRRCEWRRLKTGRTRVIWTNRFDWKAKRLFKAEQARWRIDVHFRWLKSELGLDHLLSRDPQGVMVYLLLVLLAWLFLRLFFARQTGTRWSQFSCRDVLLCFQNTLINDVIDAPVTQINPS